MRDMVCSAISAFSMFSRVPMPKVSWGEGRQRFLYLFFPFVGAVEGLLFFILGRLLIFYDCPELIRGAVLTVFPIFYTGGIHMDGFLDTVDALSSYGDRERKLEILKDPHIGGFSVIWGGVYFLLSFAFLCNVKRGGLILISFVFVFSRILSSISVIFFPAAKREGMLYSAKDKADAKVGTALIILLVLILILYFSLSVRGGLVIAVSGALAFFLHYRICSRSFGGITGDLAGFFLQIFELAAVILLVIF